MVVVIVAVDVDDSVCVADAVAAVVVGVVVLVVAVEEDASVCVVGVVTAVVVGVVVTLVDVPMQALQLHGHALRTASPRAPLKMQPPFSAVFTQLGRVSLHNSRV